MVSVTPLHLDLTDYDALKKLKKWKRSLSPGKASSVSSTQKVTKVKSRQIKSLASFEIIPLGIFFKIHGIG